MNDHEKAGMLEKYRLLSDEPVRKPEKPELFYFGPFAKQLKDFLLDENLYTPYAIALHGEWGAGKTTLLMHARDLVNDALKEQQKRDWKVLWFDAWEYERLDPAAALMQRIAVEYEGRERDFKEAIKGLTFFFLDVAIRRATNMSLEDAQKHFDDSLRKIPTIGQKLSEMIGQGRLIVFVDDLDRCHIDNALEILEAIKLFLNAKGAIFVVAVDMTKIERAWDLRYQGYKAANIEGKDYVDKIFQLRLSVPPKEQREIDDFIRRLADLVPFDLGNLVSQGCPPNPRKIKKVVSLIDFLWKAKHNEESFKADYPLTIIWAIATVCYPNLASIIRKNPTALIDTIPYVREQYQSMDYFSFSEHFKSSTIYQSAQTEHPYIKLVLTAALENMHLYEFLRVIAKESKLDGVTPQHLGEVIFRAGLMG